MLSTSPVEGASRSAARRVSAEALLAPCTAEFTNSTKSGLRPGIDTLVAVVPLPPIKYRPPLARKDKGQTG
jgi:hypothetical protein